jgi:hypothetical protein
MILTVVRKALRSGKTVSFAGCRGALTLTDALAWS